MKFKTIFLLLSVMLLFIGSSLANAPPALDVGVYETEQFYFPGDQPVIVIDAIEVVIVPVWVIEVDYNLYTRVPEATYVGITPAFKLNLEATGIETERNSTTECSISGYGVPFVERGCL